MRMVLALTTYFSWPLKQLDVKNAFWHGVLPEEVYMSQPLRFEDPNHPQLVCKPHKSLYGLKQAPRAWHENFTTFLPSIGFQSTYSDSSLFVNKFGYDVVILLLYVDDIILTGSAFYAIHQVIKSLTTEFDIKNLGDLHYFLGIDITKIVNCIFLSQSKYIQDLLHKSKMIESKHCDTPHLAYN